MTLRQATALGVRLVGLYMLLEIAVEIPQTILYLIYLAQSGGAAYGMGAGEGLSSGLFVIAGRICVGLVLLIRAVPISGWLYTDADPERASPAIAGEGFFRGGIALVGLTIAALGIPDLLMTVVAMRTMGMPGLADGGAADPLQVQAMSEILTIVIGIILMRLAATIARSVRNSWTDPEIDEASFD